MKRLFFTLILVSAYILLSSHEFWLQPEKFIYQRNEEINVRFQVGENFEGVNWKGNRGKINSFRLYYGGVSDNIPDLVGRAEGDSLQFHVYDEGNVLLAFNSTNSFISIEAAKFNEYLQEDGLKDAIQYRTDHQETDSTGRELYQRCSKTLLQVGDLQTAAYRTPTQLPLDIIPLNNPYQLNNGDSLRVKILFLKQPLSNTAIKIWHRENGNTGKQEMVSNEKGEISFPLTSSGQWMISTVKMIRLQNNPQADWQSYWGSFVWGYQ